MSVAIGDYELDLSTRRAWPSEPLNAVRDSRGDGSRVATVAKADALDPVAVAVPELSELQVRWR